MIAIMKYCHRETDNFNPIEGDPINISCLKLGRKIITEIDVTQCASDSEARAIDSFLGREVRTLISAKTRSKSRNILNANELISSTFSGNI